MEDEETEKEDAAKVAKQLKKREKERARKEAKRAAAKAAAAAEAEKKTVVKEETKEPEKKLTKEEAAKAKKKKQKEKAKAKKAALKAGLEEKPAAPAKKEKAAPTEPADIWEEVKVKKGKKKAEPEDMMAGGAKAEHDEMVYVERKHFGTIIGPGGSYLRAITEATGTSIELPKEGGMRPEIVISGSVQGCALAKSAIAQLVAKGYSNLTHAGTVDRKIAIPDKKRGIVIGSRGANLKALQQKLNVKIDFPEKGSEEDVTVVGDDKDVQQCLAAIKQLLEQGFSEITHANFIKADVEVHRDMLKNLIGPGGEVIKALQATHRVQLSLGDKSGEVTIVTILGEAQDVAECRVQMAQLLVPPEPTPIPEEWTQAASLQYVDVW